MKAPPIALVRAVAAPLRLSVTILGGPVQFPAGWLILAAEVLVTAAAVWLAVRALRGFRSSPWLRLVCPAATS